MAELDSTESSPNPVFAGLKPEVVSERRAARQARAIAAAAGALPLIAAGAVTWATAAPDPVILEPQGQAPAPVTNDDATDATSTSGASTHTVKQGDSLQSIATQHGIPTAALLALNGLSWQTSVHAGQVLVVSKQQRPAVAEAEPLPALVETPVLASGVRAHVDGHVADDVVVSTLTSEMATNARIIIQVGRELRIPNYGIVIALATAAQESKLRNLDYGDLDSVGLFQQRPASGWGTVSQIRDPRYAAKAFYGGSASPCNNRGLLDIEGWQNMSVTEAAQAVQISAYPNAYAKWEVSAWNWLFDLT